MKYTFTIFLADKAVKIVCSDKKWHTYNKHSWKKFITHTHSTMTLELSVSDRCKFPRLITIADRFAAVVLPPLPFTKRELVRTQSGIKRCVGRWLLKHDIYLIHGSAVIDNRKKAYIFSGKKGAGKSTIVKLLQQMSFLTIADDTVFIQAKAGIFFCYPTPFVEKNAITKLPGQFRVHRFYFLHKSKRNREALLKTKEQFRRILTLFYITASDSQNLFDVLIQKVAIIGQLLPAYHLYFRKDVSIAILLQKSKAVSFVY